MRIVVTGATSFIGRAVVEELLDKRHQVFAAVRPDSAGRGELETMQRETGGQLTVLPVDLSACGTLDRHPALEGRADLWLHLGWEGSGSANRTNPEIQARNIGYALEALGAAARLGCTRFLFSGSQAEYGIHREATVLCARIPPAIRCQSTARTSWRCAAGPGRRPGSWESPICTHGFSAFTVRETIPGPWCPVAWTPF